MKVEQNDVLLAVAKLVWKYEISINEFYEFLGVNLKDYRVDADHDISTLAGIITGWQTSPGDD